MPCPIWINYWPVTSSIKSLNKFPIEERFEIVKATFPILPWKWAEEFYVILIEVPSESRHVFLKFYEKQCKNNDNDDYALAIGFLFYMIQDQETVGKIVDLVGKSKNKDDIFEVIGRLPWDLRGSIPIIENIITLMDFDYSYLDSTFLCSYLEQSKPAELPANVQRALAFKKHVKDADHLVDVLSILDGIQREEEKNLANDCLIVIEKGLLKDAVFDPFKILNSLPGDQILPLAQFFAKNIHEVSMLETLCSLLKSNREKSQKKVFIEKVIPLLDEVSDPEQKQEVMRLAFKFPEKRMAECVKTYISLLSKSV